MQELPNKIKINGIEFKIIFPYAFRERADIQAQCDMSLYEIKINKYDASGLEKNPIAVLVSLLHEILHAIDISHGSCIFPSDRKEECIESMGYSLYQILVENPKFLELFKTYE